MTESKAMLNLILHHHISLEFSKRYKVVVNLFFFFLNIFIVSIAYISSKQNLVLVMYLLIYFLFSYF